LSPSHTSTAMEDFTAQSFSSAKVKERFSGTNWSPRAHTLSTTRTNQRNNTPWRFPVRINKQTLSRVLMLAIVITSIAVPRRPFAQTAEAKSSSATRNSSPGQWSVLVEKVDAGDINLAPSFQIAIYEGLLDELSKTKRFKQVLRDGDRNASEIANLLTL